MKRTLALCLLVTLAGCAKPKNASLPTVPTMSVADSISFVNRRAATLERVTGRGPITLVDAGRGAVTLDGIFVLAPPDRARIRAYKFTQAVFDMTLNADGLFIFVPRERGKPGELLDATSGAAGAIRQWLSTFAGQIDTADAQVRETSRTISITRRDANGMTRTMEIDRRTLTRQAEIVRDADGRQRFGLTFDEYRDFDSTLWPTRIVATSDRGQITVETHELQPNVAADAAFTPPPRAVEVK